ncbi:hypothetical protein BC830DRAFT_1172881 [Chytriomyces sp. MP71]|nr:hypothetical protein BC830DRAFT_1172881 [Chytriomyces sp. MP71]
MSGRGVTVHRSRSCGSNLLTRLLAGSKRTDATPFTTTSIADLKESGGQKQDEANDEWYPHQNFIYEEVVSLSRSRSHGHKSVNFKPPILPLPQSPQQPQQLQRRDSLNSQFTFCSDSESVLEVPLQFKYAHRTALQLDDAPSFSFQNTPLSSARTSMAVPDLSNNATPISSRRPSLAINPTTEALQRMDSLLVQASRVLEADAILGLMDSVIEEAATLDGGNAGRVTLSRTPSKRDAIIHVEPEMLQLYATENTAIEFGHGVDPVKTLRSLNRGLECIQQDKLVDPMPVRRPSILKKGRATGAVYLLVLSHNANAGLLGPLFQSGVQAVENGINAIFGIKPTQPPTLPQTPPAAPLAAAVPPPVPVAPQIANPPAPVAPQATLLPLPPLPQTQTPAPAVTQAPQPESQTFAPPPIPTVFTHATSTINTIMSITTTTTNTSFKLKSTTSSFAVGLVPTLDTQLSPIVMPTASKSNAASKRSLKGAAAMTLLYFIL